MANPNQPTLHPGATGPAVRRLQRALRRTPNLGLVVDRVFGPRTETAVRDFQDQPDLVVDGIVGPATWAARGGAVPLLRRGSTGDVGWCSTCSGRWPNSSGRSSGTGR